MWTPILVETLKRESRNTDGLGHPTDSYLLGTAGSELLGPVKTSVRVHLNMRGLLH